MSIYTKLHTIQKAVNGLSKDSNGQNYQYVSGTKILSHIKPLMAEHGLILKQEIVSIENERQNYATKNNPNKSEILSKVMMRFTWIDVETGEKDENSFGANGQNDWDKGVGSALTYGERYFLLKYFHIATDEDDVDGIQREEQTDPVPELIMQIRSISTESDLKEFWDMWSDFHKDQRFKTAVTNRKKQLIENQK